jgi:hypothetical protein
MQNAVEHNAYQSVHIVRMLVLPVAAPPVNPLYIALYTVWSLVEALSTAKQSSIKLCQLNFEHTAVRTGRRGG